LQALLPRGKNRFRGESRPALTLLQNPGAPGSLTATGGRKRAGLFSSKSKDLTGVRRGNTWSRNSAEVLRKPRAVHEERKKKIGLDFLGKCYNPRHEAKRKCTLTKGPGPVEGKKGLDISIQPSQKHIRALRDYGTSGEDCCRKAWLKKGVYRGGCHLGDEKRCPFARKVQYAPLWPRKEGRECTRSTEEKLGERSQPL